MGEIGPGANEHERQGGLAGSRTNRKDVKPELAISGKLLTRTALAYFDCEKVKIRHGEEEDNSAGRLVILKFPDSRRDKD